MFRRTLAQIQCSADFVDGPAFVMAQCECRALDCRQVRERLVDEAMELRAFGQSLGTRTVGRGERRRLIEDLGARAEAMASGAVVFSCAPGYPRGSFLGARPPEYKSPS